VKEEKEVWEESGRRWKQPSFHPVFGRSLTVALRATFPGDAAVFLEELDFPELVSPAPEIHLTREQKRYVGLRAVVVCNSDMSEATEGEIVLASWLKDMSEVQCYHVTLRTQNIARDNNRFRWIKFGRFGEEKTFGFSPMTKKYFINLIFNLEADPDDPDQQKLRTDFVPVFGKIQDGEDFVYFEISAEVSEEGVTLKVRRVVEAEVPLHLAEAKP